MIEKAKRFSKLRFNPTLMDSEELIDWMLDNRVGVFINDFCDPSIEYGINDILRVWDTMSQNEDLKAMFDTLVGE